MKPTKAKTQRAITVIYDCLKVTTCLYLSPNNRARSLSILIAANINKDTKQKKIPRYSYCSKCKATNTPSFIHRRHPEGNTKRLHNDTNTEIRYCQAAKQQFGGRMKRPVLVKGDKDQSISQKSSNGKKNVQH